MLIKPILVIIKTLFTYFWYKNKASQSAKGVSVKPTSLEIPSIQILMEFVKL